MKKYTSSILFLLIMCSAMISGCEIVGGIFKAGMWTGTIIVILVIALVIYIVSRLFGRNKN
jgi:hypothetical protein